MADIGKINQLKIVRSSDIGLFLDGGTHGEILLPKRYVLEDYKAGEPLDVFIMLDSEDRLIATTERPLAMVGEFAKLQAISTTPVGAFLDWGLPKDLFVPFREQKAKMVEGQFYVVYVYLDQTSGRIAASSKLDKFLSKENPAYTAGESVDLLIYAKTDLGYKAIINNKHSGVIFHNEVFAPLEQGQLVAGFIKQVRPDGKIDLSLTPPGYEKIADISDRILQYIKEQGGFIPITDKSPAEEIYALFNVSKKTYKKAIGSLYKRRLICFENNGTQLIADS